jgi:hypothetical protein
MIKSIVMLTLQALCLPLNITRSFVAPRCPQTSCLRFTTAKSLSTTQKPTTATQRYPYPTRSQSLQDYEHISTRQFTKGRLPFLWLFRPRQISAKQAPIDPRIYTAKIKRSNRFEPIVSFYNQKRSIAKKYELRIWVTTRRRKYNSTL